MSGAPQPVRFEPQQPSAAERLDSWKEIAVYLKRSVRSVRRWESEEELPVHRHQHQSSGTVYAFKDELDAWWANRSTELASVAAGVVAAIRAEGEAAARPVLNWRSVLLVTVVVLTVAAVGFVAYEKSWFRARPPAGNIMLAVLRFEDVRREFGEEYFGGGFTEETITQLGELSPDHLGVIARTSVMRYRKTQESVDQIGRELHVYYILEGSVRREADRVRVTAQLIRVNDQTHVWAARYDRNVNGVLSLQGEIAQAIARAVEIKLSPEQKMRLASVQPVNAEAHEAYLRGRYLWSTHTEEGLNRSIAYFQQAIAIDPNRSGEHTSELQSHLNLVCRLLLEKKKQKTFITPQHYKISSTHASR